MKIKGICALAILLLFGACAKNNNSVYNGSKIKTRYDLRTGIGYAYSYNGDGMLTRIEETSGNQTLFTYDNDTVTVQNYNGANVLTSGYTYLLNSDNRADTATGMELFQKQSYQYTYSANGMLAQVKTYGFGNLTGIDNYSLTGSNIGFIEHINPGNSTHTYDYYEYIAANGNTLGNQSMGQDFLGVQTANLINRNVKIDNNGDTSDIITYRYRFDGQSRTDTLVRYTRNGVLVDSMGYSYY